MGRREVVMLGTASQVPTPERSQTACLLRWDDEAILFDPGEGAQRQLARAGISSTRVGRICITHFHGDHCLGLPGMLMKISLDDPQRPIPVHYPASGEASFGHLRNATIGQARVRVDPRPVEAPGVVDRNDAYTLSCSPLSHSVDTIGYRLVEPDGRRFLPELLAHRGVEGADIGRLREVGRITVGGETVAIEDVSEPRRGQVVAFVMDTRWCDGAVELAADADLLVCESTFLSCDADLAERYGHLTARQAGRLAREAGARRLVLGHFSRRYPESHRFGDEARDEFDDVVVPDDLDVVEVPPLR